MCCTFCICPGKLLLPFFGLYVLLFTAIRCTIRLYRNLYHVDVHVSEAGNSGLRKDVKLESKCLLNIDNERATSRANPSCFCSEHTQLGSCLVHYLS
jgi:hypothetical protein